MKKSVTVVIPAYNEEHTIGKVLQDLKKQDYKDNFEIIVVDNNSTDNTSEIAKSLGAKVILEKQKGTRFAYQAGMSAAKTDLILVTNADVKLPKDWISSIVKYYKDPEVVGVGTHIKFYNCSPLINIGWFFLRVTGDILIKLNLFGIKERTFWGTSLSCTREVFEKVGGINHGSDLNEDMIFTKLISKHGKTKYIYDTVVLMDGRRYNQGLNKTLKEVGKLTLNSVIIALTSIVIFKTFKDYRQEDKETKSYFNRILKLLKSRIRS